VSLPSGSGGAPPRAAAPHPCRTPVPRARPAATIHQFSSGAVGRFCGMDESRDGDALVEEILRAYAVFGVDPTSGADELGMGDWLERLHPRDKFGQWREVLGRLLGRDGGRRAILGDPGRDAIDGVADSLLERLREGGFTYNVPTGNYPKHGNSVAIPGFGKEFDSIDQITRKELVDYTLQNWDELTKDPTRHLGGWLEDGKVFLDVAEVVEDTVEESLDRARSRGEIAAFDLATFETSYVPYYRDAPPPPGSAAARALALPEGHKDLIHWAGDSTPRRER